MLVLNIMQVIQKHVKLCVIKFGQEFIHALQ